MADAVDLEAQLTSHLPLIDRVAQTVARRHGIVGADAEDCASWVKLRLIESEYAILRKFRGESSFSTYLTVAVSMLVRDYRIQQKGRWRPSAAAHRLGRVAVQLETMVRRDAVPFREAVARLRSREETSLSDRELAALLQAVPARGPLRPVEVADDAALEVATLDSDDPLEAAERELQGQQVRQALTEAMAMLPAEDRVMLRMRFWEDMSVADIARGLGVAQKPLYRRLEKALATLRAQLQVMNDRNNSLAPDGGAGALAAKRR